ncbi:beta strand repeat-containing protein [Marinoscillum sp.]|uniref:beta strand repeat-containing protein n=1 Tax=Marinoscillum sp. TaxID=2024838 RepID=UPI003BA87850
MLRKPSTLAVLLLFTLTIVYSQTGPAGVGNSTNNILWLDAQNPSSLSAALVNDDPVTTWSDLSGNGNDFLQQAADPVPLFRNDGLDAGTFNVVQFDGTERYLTLADNDDLDLNLDELTIIGVYNRVATDASARGILSKRTSFGSQMSYYIYTYTGNDLHFAVNTSGNTVLNSNNPTVSGDNLFTVAYNGSQQQIFLGSDDEGSNSKTGTVNNSTSNFIMGALNNDYGTYFNGELAEVIMFRTALNGAERLIIENYLADKYGLTITNDFFGNYTDYDAAYDDDLRAIGTANGTDLHDISGYSSGLQLEATAQLDATNEFAFFAHDAGTAHATGAVTNIDGVNVTERWAKDYYIETSQNGLTDAASIETKFRFDFSEAGLTLSGASTDFVLLYRSTTADDFTRVFANSYAIESTDQVVVSIPSSRLRSGYYTLGKGTQITSRTWYVLQNGDWSDSDTWTLDAGSAPIPNNPLDEVPGIEDDVIIRNGKTVTIQSTTNNLTVASVTVDGTLDMTTSSGHDFNIINGQGIIRISGNGGVSNFPDGNTITSNGFGNPANGGLLQVRGTGFTFDQDEVFKDVRIRLDNNTDVIELGADLTVNGDFDVRFGTFQFGDGSGTSRTLTVLGDFSVENNGSTQDGRVTTANVPASSARHQFNLYGNFLNEGTAQFSDRTAVNYAAESTNGVVDINLVSTNSDQQIDCNGLTYFYRLEIVKGSVDFTANIQADDPGNFILTGYANDNVDGDVDAPNDNDNAFALITGTASLGTNVSVRLNTTGNYSIGANAKLLVNGANVTKTGGAAVTPYGVLEVAAGILEVPSGSGITTRDAGQINVSGGQVWVSQIRTSIQGSVAQGGFQQTGGTVNVWDYSAGESPILGQAAGSANADYARFALTYEGNAFTMTGGTLNIKDATGSGLLFINSDPDNISVTGGTVNLYSSITGNSIVSSEAPFWNLNIYNSNAATSAKITIDSLTNGPGGVNDRKITDSDLVVYNDLRIKTSTTRTSGSNTYGAYLDLCPLNNCSNLEVGGDLYIEDSGVLDVWAWDGSDNDGSATVTMNGGENAVLYVGDITTYTNSLVEFEYPDAGPWPSGFGSGDETYGVYTLPFYNWVIDKDDAVLYLAAKSPGKGDGSPGSNASLYKTSGGGKNLSRYAVRLVVVTNEFQLLSGTLNQNDPFSTLQLTESDGTAFGTVGDPVGYGMYLLGSITNQGQCFVYEDGTTRKEGTVNIRAGGDVTINSTEGSGFGNLEINNAGFDITLTSDLSVGRLQYAAGVIDIGTNNLKVDVFEFLDLSSSGFIPAVGGQGVYSTSDYIRMAGNASDGGLSIKMPRSLTLYESATPSFPDANYTEEYNIVDRATYYVDGQVYNTPDRLWFPIGTAANSTERYTPAVMHVVDDAGVTYDGDEYVTVRVVDKELQTTDLTGGDILSYYWKVSTEGFDAGLPEISWIFQYDDSDIDGGDETNYVPGKVESSGSYLRSNDGTDQAVKDGGAAGNSGNIVGTNPGNIIMFNGTNVDAVGDDANDEIDSGTADGVYDQGNVDNNWTTPWPGTGFTLEEANYTAGESARFVGAPEIFYTRKTSNGDQNWNTQSTWSTVGVQGATASSLPGAGDVVILGAHNGPSINGSWTQVPIRLDVNINTTVAEIQFEEAGAGEERARLFPQSGTDHDWGRVIGNGEIQLFFSNSGNVPTFDATNDFGDFLNNENSTWNLAHQGGAGTGNAVVMPTFPSEFPTLRITATGGSNGGTDGWGNQRIVTFTNPIQVNSQLQVANRAALWVQDDITVNGDAEVGVGYGHGRIRFDNGTVSHTLSIGGDLRINGNNTFGADSYLDIESGGGNGVNHELKVGGDISLTQDDASDDAFLDLFTTSADNNVILELQGEGDHSLTNTTASVPDLYQLVLNKGSDTTNSFTISAEISLTEPTDIGAQSIEIVNGLLILDDPAIDVVLADGTQGSFYLPNAFNDDASSGSGGLEIAQGNATISGDNIGLILDGLLRISGGTLDMSVTGDNGNNFIEYGSSDNATIDVSAGSLLVGSQVRRKLTAVTGLLNYSQSGGIARFGIEAAPAATRGVFEVINSGSEFTLTGGEFTIVRENGSSTVGSLIIKPDVDDVDVTGSTITIGSADTPANQDDIGIDSNVGLSSLLITGNNNPTAKIYNTDLEVNAVTIESGGTFDANGYDFTVNGDFDNDGFFVNGGTDINQQTTYFPSNSAQDILGSGTTEFFNLEKSGSGTLTVSNSFTVANDLSVLGGTLSTGTSAVYLEGDMVHDAIHTSASAGPGIVFSGGDGQNLDTSVDTGEFGVLTIDNSNGVEIPGDGKTFQINDKIILSSGVLNIGGNLLIMNESAIFENGSGGTSRTDFNTNSMVTVNASITDNGVRKIYNDAFVGTYLYPIGLNYYTPAEINVTSLTGGNAGEITIKPIEDIAGGIPDDSDETCFGDNSDYVDLDNILQFYWLLRSNNITDFDGSIFLYHVDNLEAVDNTQGLDLTNYAPARLLDNTSSWDKNYSETLFDEVANVSMFQASSVADYANLTSDDLSGTYTAGITRDDSDAALCGGAIPDVVPEYVTEVTGSGDVDDILSYATLPGGTAPGLGESPDLRIAGDFTLTLTNEFWRFRKVTIESGATLNISGAGVNLGTLTGDGTLRLTNTNSLPAGEYTSFEADAGCTTGGGFELNVTTGNNVDLALPFDRLRRLILSGDGDKVLTNGSSFDICENLEILDAGSLTLGDNTTLNIKGNIIKDPTASFDGDFNNALIIMDGSSQQTIDGDFTGAEALQSLEVDNSAGLTIDNAADDNVEVEDLIMTNGRITTNADNSLIILNTGSITGNFGSSTFVDGPLLRRLETSTDVQFFPVGDGTVYLPFSVSNTQGYGGTKDWMVQYHDRNPTTASSLITNVNATYDFSTWSSEVNDAKSKIFKQDLFEVSVASPATADVRPYWDGDSNVGSGQSTWQYLRVMVWDAVDQTWESYGNGNLTYSGMSASSGSVISDTDLSFSTNFVTLGSNEPVPLPVDLVEFKATAKDGVVILDWQTASEKSNDRFEVERINQDGEFEIIGIVKGSGDSNELLAYQFTDQQPYRGINYYRLRQVDFDGQYEYSGIVAANNDSFFSGMDVSIYPNPIVGPEVNVRITTGDELSEIQFVLMDASGRVLNKQQVKPTLGMADYLVEFSEEIGSGVFYLVVVQGDNKRVVRMVAH